MSDVIQTAIAELVTRRVKHSDLEGVLLSFTSVDVSPDLAHARVTVSVYGDAAERKKVLAALHVVEPFLHRELGKQLHIRRVPRLHFESDDSMAEADRITGIMRDVAHAEGRDL